MKGENIDKWIEDLRNCKYLPEKSLMHLCQRAKDILIEENNMIEINPPAIVCGDIHGQLFDLLKLFETSGSIENGNLHVFLGDYVDRGYYSIETFSLLLAYKVKYPNLIYLLRGNHESKQITKVYGFYDECVQKYGSSNPWKYCTAVFDVLPISVLIGGRVLGLHGGLSPILRTIHQVRRIEREDDVPPEGLFSDILWSDPDNKTKNWRRSPRGAGFLFGEKVANRFTSINKLELICRSHQTVQEGYKYELNGKKVVTVWSAPNYFYRVGNKASILRLDSELNREFRIFTEVEREKRKIPGSTIIPMFM